MRCARRIGCLAGLTGLRGPRLRRNTGLSGTRLGCGGRLTRLRGGCLSIRLCISVYLSGLRRLLRLNGLLRYYRCGRLSNITLLARLHRLARLSNLSCITRLSSLTRKRSILRGVCAGVVAVAVAAGCTLRRVVGSVLRH